MQTQISLQRFGALALAGRLVLALCLALTGSLALPLAAATLDLPAADQAPAGRGAALQQRFLDSGASVVTTATQRYCAISQRIDIAASEYRAAGGALVPYDQVIRSPAASTQVMAGADGLMGLRVQMKYSPAPGAGILLTIGTGTEGSGTEDVAGLLEPSTDSLRLNGAVAARLVAAFRAGLPVRLAATSRATGRRVSDVLAAPDMVALDACQTDLATAPAAPLPPLANQVSLDFDVSPSPETRATVDDYRACGMKPTDAPLHLGRIKATTGFFSHTNKVFVSFDDNGKLDRVYVPGLLDAGFGGTSSGEAQVSLAADSNTPDAENAVTGCIGSAALAMCDIEQIGGDGHRLQVCDVLPAGDALGEELAYLAPTSGGGSFPGGDFGSPGGNGGDIGGGGVGGGGEGGEEGGGDGGGEEGGGEGGGEEPPPPSPVPLPPAGLLLLAALTATAALRRRQG